MLRNKRRSPLKRLLSAVTALSSTVCMLPAIPGLHAAAAETTYGLWICENQVTSANASDILGDGVFSYNAGACKLTVSGNCSASASLHSIIRSNIDNLTINVASDSDLSNPDGYGLTLWRNTTITGPGKLNAYGAAGGILLDDAKLTAKNANLDISGKYGIIGLEFSNLEFDHSSVHVTGTEEISYFCINSIIRPLLTDCIYTTPYGSDGIQMGSYINNDGNLADGGLLYNGSPLMEFEITPVNSYYGLTVGGVDVNNVNASDILGDGKFAYNAATNTLTMRGDYSAPSTGGNMFFVRNEIPDLTIKTISDTTISGYYNGIYSDSADITVTGDARLTIRAGSAAIATEFSDLTIWNANLDLEGCYGLSGAPENSELLVINSTIHAKGSEAAIFDFESGVSFEDCYIISPENTYFDDENLYDDHGEIVTEVLIRQTPIERYDLKVAGVQVTEKNASDILGNGKFSYNASTNTLKINGSYTNNTTGAIIDNRINGLKVVVAADSVINMNNCGIYSNHADITITGTGSTKKLTLNTPSFPILIENGGTLTIRDLNLEVSGETGILGYEGSNRLVVNKATVHATGTVAAISNFTDGIRLDNCVITSPQNADYSQGIVLDAYGNTMKEVTIKPATFYGVTVAGQRVHSLNASDILGDGKFSYDANTKTLTLNGNYTINNRKDFIYNSLNGLTINVASDSTITTNGYGIYIASADTTITGSGKLTINAEKDAIYYNRCSLTVRDADLNLKGKCAIAGSWEGETLNVINSTIHAEGTYAIDNLEYGVEYQDCYVASPENAIYEFCICYPDGTPAKVVDIVPLKTYDLTVAGVQVTNQNAADVLGDGNITFDTSSYTLRLNGSYTMNHDKNFIESSIGGLNIVVESDTTVSGCKHGILADHGNISFFGTGKLTIDADDYGIKLMSSTLRLNQSMLDVKGSTGIYGDTASKLYATNSMLHAQGTQGAVYNVKGGIQLQDCSIITPAGGSISGGAIVDANGNRAKEVLIQPDVKYSLYVGGTQVTGLNYTDILGNGRFSYDPESNILTVNGNFTSDQYVSFISSRIHGLTVYVASDSSVTCGADGIYSKKADITITGPGKLTLNSTGPNAYGIDMESSSLTIRDADIDAKGVYGIIADNDDETLTVINSRVRAEGTNGAVCSFGNGITLTDCQITSPEGATIENGSICNADGTRANVVDIVPLVKYDLYILRTQVTDRNASDILGDGVFSYDADSNTLTVDGDFTTSSGFTIIENHISGLTINVASDSVITGPRTGITSNGQNLTITGNGKLSINSGRLAIYVANATLTIDHANLDVTGVIGLAGKKLNVIESTIHAECEMSAINSFADGIELQDCYIASPEDAFVSENGTVCNVNGSSAETVDIEISYPPTITQHPVDFTGEAGTIALFTVEATGAGTLSYQWQVNSGNGWNDTSFSGAKTPTLKVPITAARNGFRYHCVVSSSNTKSSTSDPATLIVRPSITTQPVDFIGEPGTTAKFTVTATGAGTLSYQWQVNTGSGWKNSNAASAKTAELTFTVSAARDGYQYRCLVSSSNNASNLSEPATLKVRPKITTQPTDYIGEAGTTAKFSVTASGAGTLSYQWQYNAGSGWKNSNAASAKTPELSFTASVSRDGYQYRCMVSSSNNTSTPSEPATLKVKPTIKTQPQDYTGEAGTTTTFSVTATGAGTLRYQWQYNAGSGWKNSNAATAKTAEIKVTASVSRDGYQYRCIVSSSNNTSTPSEAATLKVKPTIKTQPQDYTGEAGTSTTFSVTATGAGTLSYQWQYNAGSGWKNSNAATAKTPQINVTASVSRDGYQYRCIVSSSNNTSTPSEPATLKVKPTVKTQPQDLTAAPGSTAKFSVTATGAGTLSYQWQVNTGSGWKDSGAATATTPEISFTATASRSGYQYRCIVSSSNGTSTPSEAATLTVQ